MKENNVKKARKKIKTNLFIIYLLPEVAQESADIGGGGEGSAVG